MKKQEPQMIITFHTTAEAMATERACKGAGLEGRLIPVPRNLSAGCGIAWRGPAAIRGETESLLTVSGIEYAGVYIM